MSTNQQVQDAFIEQLIEKQTKVNVYLVNGIKLQGVIKEKDDFVVLLANTLEQLVYKHAISTIIPVMTNTFRADESKTAA